MLSMLVLHLPCSLILQKIQSCSWRCSLLHTCMRNPRQQGTVIGMLHAIPVPELRSFHTLRLQAAIFSFADDGHVSFLQAIGIHLSCCLWTWSHRKYTQLLSLVLAMLIAPDTACELEIITTLARSITPIENPLSAMSYVCSTDVS